MNDLPDVAPDPLADVDAEAALLGGLMIDNRQIDLVCDRLAGNDFSEPLHGRIFDAAVREHCLGKAVSPVTLKHYFSDDPAMAQLGGASYLARLSGDAQGLFAISTLCDIIADLATRRRMRAGFAEAFAACADTVQPIANIVANADAALVITGAEFIHQPTGGQCLDELIDSFGQEVLGVTCGIIPQLDAVIGPMRPKQLVIGAGRPGMGKTALALSYALGAASLGHGVLFVSLEMSSTELGARMAADLCFDRSGGVPFSAIRDGKLSESQRRHVARAASTLHGWPFQVVDAGHLTIGRLNMLVRRHARRMAAKGHDLKLVVIDYLQLVSPDTKGRSNYEAVSEVSRGLKAMAKDQGLAVFALAQLSRDVEKRPDKRPQLSDLRDSGQIEQDADVVLFLLRQEYYLRQAEPEPGTSGHVDWDAALGKVSGQIEFIAAKRRNGVTGSGFGQFHAAYQAVRGEA